MKITYKEHPAPVGPTVYIDGKYAGAISRLHAGNCDGPVIGYRWLSGVWSEPRNIEIFGKAFETIDEVKADIERMLGGKL